MIYYGRFGSKEHIGLFTTKCLTVFQTMFEIDSNQIEHRLKIATKKGIFERLLYENDFKCGSLG